MGDISLSLYALLAFMVIGSLIAVETADLLSSVICLGAVGFGLAVVDLFLGAPDLAITQVVVEILCLVLLIRLVVTREDTTEETKKDTLAVGSVLLGIGVLFAACYWAFQGLVAFGKPLMTVSKGYLAVGLKETGAANYVMAVLLDFRAYDTLGEATVIFASIIGAYVVIRKIGRKHDEGNVADS